MYIIYPDKFILTSLNTALGYYTVQNEYSLWNVPIHDV